MYNWYMKIEADQKKAEANLKKHEITIRLISARRAARHRLFVSLATQSRTDFCVDSFERFGFEISQSKDNCALIQRKEPRGPNPVRFRQFSSGKIIVPQQYGVVMS